MNPGTSAERTDSRDAQGSEPSYGPHPRSFPGRTAHRTSPGSDQLARNGLRLAVKIVLFLGILVFLNYAMGWLANLVAFQMWPEYVDMAAFLLLGSIVSYILLMVIPFLPGIEVGLVLMAILGTKGIVLVYLCTILALSLSFLLGRLLPPRYLARALGWFHLVRARDLVTALEPLTPEERLPFLLQSTPSRTVPFLLRHRYLVLAVLLNVPGNAIIGDGGGIALIAGMSGLFSFPKYLLLVSLAITPVPLFFLARNAWS